MLTADVVVMVTCIQDTLVFMLDHLKRISLKSSVNQMTSSNLAVIFGPLLLCPSPHLDQDRRLALNFDQQIQLVKYLIDVWPDNRGQLASLRILTENATL